MLTEQNMGINLTTTMKTKNNTILSFAKVFIVVDLCLIVIALTFYDLNWLLNSQIAFIGSLSVTIASFLSYKKNITNRLSNLDTSKHMTTDDRDKIDEIDDPYDLYSEYEEIPEEELTPEKIKEIITEEKKNVKKNSFKNTVFSAGGFVSLYRIVGYAFLIFGFFALNNNKLFLAVPFLVGLGVVPLSVLAAKFFVKSNQE